MEYGDIMRNIALVVILVCFAGCTTTQWNQIVWGNPNGAWWKNPPVPQQTSMQYGAICDVCQRNFVVTEEVLQNNQEVICPYCGARQDTKMAIGRYINESQRQQQAQQQIQYPAMNQSQPIVLQQPDSSNNATSYFVDKEFQDATNYSHVTGTSKKFGSVDQSNNNQPVIYIKRGADAKRIGDTTIYDDGSTAHQIGGTTIFDNGTTAHQIGSTTIFDNGGTAKQIGQTTIYDDGSTSKQIGSAVIFDDGDTASKVGKSVLSGH